MISVGHCGGCSSDHSTPAPTIAQAAAADGRFTTLVAAVDAAGLTETLNSKGDYTVFAPTDEAFKKLPDGTVATLLKSENKETLKGILLYHVVPGHFHASDVVKMPSLVTANGQRLDVAMSEKGATIDGANIVITDIETSNGIIHVIDAVVLPSAKTIPQTAKETGKFKTLLAAAEAAGLVQALSADGPITVFAPTDEAFAKLPEGTVETLLKPEN
ncbi:MAG: beta-Ig-H3/fasciclin, partial [Phycisphaerae bacterium]|nr:beta-Ig-H3/fasciclin [Phycisphaerae bacterium]